MNFKFVMTFSRATDVQLGTVSRFSSKLKLLKGAIDGAPLEATEVPTVWDAFTDEPQVFYRFQPQHFS